MKFGPPLEANPEILKKKVKTEAGRADRNGIKALKMLRRRGEIAEQKWRNGEGRVFIEDEEERENGNGQRLEVLESGGAEEGYSFLLWRLKEISGSVKTELVRTQVEKQKREKEERENRHC